MYYKYLKIGLFYLLSSSVYAGETHEFMLDNGLKLIVKEDHRAPVAVSQIWYKVGAGYEQEGKTGLSHMLEHMMFKGTEKHAPGEFSKIMAANGASENAFTSMDYTAYFQTIEKSRLPICFEMEADRMTNLRLTKEEFVKENKVVLEERRTRTEDDPISLMYEHFQGTAYQTSPYQNPVIGWMNDIENQQLEDLQAWYEHWYAPNNATLIVVGDVNPQEILESVKQYFGHLKPRKITAIPERPEIKQLGTKRITVKRPAKLPYFTMGYKVPSLKTIDAENQWEVFALEILAEILDGDSSARLTKHLIRGEEIATTVGASYSLLSRLEDLFTFSGIPTEKHTVAELEDALRKQIKELQTTLVDETELKRVRTQLRASIVYELDSIFYQGMKIGISETIGLDWRWLDSYLDKIQAVTAEQVQAVARKYLVDDNLTIGVLEPLPLDQPSK